MLEPADEPGFITIERDGETAGLVAINPDCRNESDLSFMSGDEAADSLGLRSYMILDAAVEFAADIHRAREGREISVALIGAAIVLFVLELVVAQRMRTEAGA